MQKNVDFFKKILLYSGSWILMQFFMNEIIRKFSYIMIANLIIFLSIWYVLDFLLDEKSKYKIIFLLLSVISLIFLSKNFFKKALKDMEKFSPVIKENNKQNKNDSTK